MNLLYLLYINFKYFILIKNEKNILFGIINNLICFLIIGLLPKRYKII